MTTDLWPPLVVNRRRQIILRVAGLAVMCLLLYPPMWGVNTNEARLYYPVGHGWFWVNWDAEYQIPVGVNWPVLLTYMFGISLIAGLGWLGLGDIDDKKCPQCAERNKAEAVKCQFCGSDLSDVVGEGVPTVRKLTCQECKVPLVPVQKAQAVSIHRIISVLIILGGILTLIANVVVGILAIIIGLIVWSVGRAKNTVMTCPQCGHQGARL
jgi:hypothetical protein